MRLAGQAIYGVALGVVLTAFVQAVLAGIGLAAVGVPFAVMLTAVMFITAIVQDRCGSRTDLRGCVALLDGDFHGGDSVACVDPTRRPCG